MKAVATLFAVAAAFAPWPAAHAQAQSWPSQPVRIVVPYTAGGPADVLARVLGQQLTQKWGQPVVVDNKPGANEMIAAQEVARARPDGHTLLMASDAVYSLNQHLYSKIPYEPNDFVPVTKLVTANLMLVARPDLPVNSVKELVDYARKNPGKLNYASVGAGGVNHLGMAWFNTLNNLDMQHVPYKGLAQALQDMTTSRVDVGFAVMGGAVPLVNAGKLKALAVSGKSRAPIAPNVPTFAEAGYPNFDASFYFAVAAPKGTPEAVARKFAQDAATVVNSEEFKNKQLLNLGFEAVADTPDEFAKFLVTDRALAEKKVKASGARLD